MKNTQTKSVNPLADSQHHPHPSETKPSLLRRQEVERRTGLSCSQIYALQKNGDFPSAINIGTQAVAWIDKEVDAWIESRITDSRKAA